MSFKIISGGQTGVDRAALDAAMSLGISHSGWCPAGRRAEDGHIPELYELKETDSPDYTVRTRLNVRDADATLLLARTPLAGGSALTLRVAEELERPHLVVRLDANPAPEQARSWVTEHVKSALNVAGPRESEDPGIGAVARQFLERVLAGIAGE